ncbi:MAG: restriction endonuclease subunit S, partial [Clostridiales bacterium]|nr:restriction endonuclease subunit S [Clostridiales bacterium]
MEAVALLPELLPDGPVEVPAVDAADEVFFADSSPESVDSATSSASSSISSSAISSSVASIITVALVFTINLPRSESARPIKTELSSSAPSMYFSKAFEIPRSWEWVRLGTICNVARGGSPRPIKQYLTDADDGINWIKISDSDKGGKYISSAKEKIIPEGIQKSRLVYKGDFLLTNSMSFGRPYILQIDGCIHDGWLVLSEYQQCFDIDYLYHLLSSSFIYYQFCRIVSGAVVK